MHPCPFWPKRLYASLSLLALTLMVSIIPAFATDPLAAVNNLSNFIFSLIRAIGVILLGFGILQLGLSFKSHDPSQRANGMLTVAGEDVGKGERLGALPLNVHRYYSRCS